MSSLTSRVFEPGTPLVWFPTDEASGDLVNRGSAAPASLTARGSLTYRSSGLFVPPSGVYCGASSGGYFTSGQGWSVGDTSFSVAAWFKTISTDGVATYAGSDVANVIVGDWSGSVARGFGVHGGLLRYSHYQSVGGAWVKATGTTSVNDGAWHLAGLTYDASTDAVLVYLDNALAAEATATATANPGTASFAALGAGYGSGAQTNAADGFDGSLAAGAGWSTVLTPTQFRTIYQAGIRSGVFGG